MQPKKRVRNIMGAVAVTGAVLALGACGSSDSSYDSNAQPERVDAKAEALINELTSKVSSKNQDQLREFLVPDWQLVRGDGSTYTRDEYISALPDLKSWKITNVQGTQYGDTMIISYRLATDLTVDGEKFKTKPAPSLATFVKVDGKWRMTSQAYFGTPRTSN